nr:Arm DNA-binding domain-containing protein [Alistipes onderdonkii]
MERKTFNKVEVHSRLGIARASPARPSARRTFSVVFLRRKTKIDKKGKAPIYARVTTSGHAVEIFTQCHTEPDHWDQRAERSLCRHFSQQDSRK